jgi:hypothetical protein
MRMAARPDMVQQMAKHIAADMLAKGHSNVEVRVRDLLSLNGRKPRLIIDPDVDLAAQPRNLLPATWILPLSEPLPARGVLAYEGDELVQVRQDLQHRRDLQHVLVVLARVIDEKTAALRSVDDQLLARFSVDSAADYTFDADRNVLTRREPGSTTEVEVMRFEQPEARRLFMDLVGRRATMRRELAGLHVLEAEKLAAERALYDVFDGEASDAE